MTGPAESFIEVDSCQRAKNGQLISGDVFLSENVKEEGRIVSVLSDGLGSGVKASVLATMTATMALKFAVSPMDIQASAEVIMDTLPICSVRQVSYSTFTVADISNTGTLCAFFFVAVAVMVLRRTEPTRLRAFRTPAVYVIAPLAALGCLGLFFNLAPAAMIVFPVWTAIGLVIYFGYSRSRSHVGRGLDEVHELDAEAPQLGVPPMPGAPTPSIRTAE